MGTQRPEIIHMDRRVEPTSIGRGTMLMAEADLLDKRVSDLDRRVEYAIQKAIQAAACPENYMSAEVGSDMWASLQSKHNMKLACLRELLEDEMAGDGVAVYSSYRTVIEAFEHGLSDYNPVKVTGTDSSLDREEARKKFQAGETDLILVTDAGGEALNLQRAKHIVFLTRPWDPGRYVQVVGRIRRMGSQHEHVCIWHLVTPDTMDSLIDSTLVDKFGPFDVIVRGRGDLFPDASAMPMVIAKEARKLRLRKAEEMAP